jgi:hypothetical protein
LNVTLEWQELLLFSMDLLIYSSFTQVWQWWVIKGIKWRWENRIFSLCCVFLLQLFHCCLCVWCASFFF